MTPNELAQHYRDCAARWRKLIELEEGPDGGGYGRSPQWPDLRALLLEVAEGYERNAREAEARAAESEIP